MQSTSVPWKRSLENVQLIFHYDNTENESIIVKQFCSFDSAHPYYCSFHLLWSIFTDISDCHHLLYGVQSFKRWILIYKESTIITHHNLLHSHVKYACTMYFVISHLKGIYSQSNYYGQLYVFIMLVKKYWQNIQNMKLDLDQFDSLHFLVLII